MGKGGADRLCEDQISAAYPRTGQQNKSEGGGDVCDFRIILYCSIGPWHENQSRTVIQFNLCDGLTTYGTLSSRIFFSNFKVKKSFKTALKLSSIQIESERIRA